MDNIKFISVIEGVEETMPIIPASKQQYGWVKKAANHLKTVGSLTEMEEYANSNLDIRHTSKCPGIINLKSKGFIVRNHSDINLKILDKDGGYEWNTPSNWIEMSDGICENTITHHFEGSLHQFMNDWPKDTLLIVLKINLPWYVKIPKGWELIMVDPFYKDDYRFTVCPGIFEPELGLAKLNIPVHWHSTSGEFMIKAGTPIAQLIPLRKENIDFELSNKNNDKDFNKEYRLMNLKFQESFKRNYNKVREFFKSR